jgi:hypothetical protein
VSTPAWVHANPPDNVDAGIGIGRRPQTRADRGGPPRGLSGEGGVGQLLLVSLSLSIVVGVGIVIVGL